MSNMTSLWCIVVFCIAGYVVCDDDSCLNTAWDKCEGYNRGRFANALQGTTVNYGALCTSVRSLISCGSKVDCNGRTWDPTDDFLTYMVNFMEDTGACGGQTKVSDCARRASQNCLQDLVVDMKTNDPCGYYGNYAACIIREAETCDDDTVLIVGDLMMDQLADNYPAVVGGRTIAACPNWSTEYAKFIFKK